MVKGLTKRSFPICHFLPREIGKRKFFLTMLEGDTTVSRIIPYVHYRSSGRGVAGGGEGKRGKDLSRIIPFPGRMGD